MKLRRFTAATGVPVALGLILAGPALATGSAATPAPRVSVRVEGAKHTLLPATRVRPPSGGSITKAGAPAGTCRADSAAGALDVATRHRWGGTYSSGLGIEVTSILGATYTYSHGAYWGFYVNDRFASKGICATAVHAGEQLLFAPVPAKGKTPLPLVVRAPTKVRAGRAFTVRVFDYSAARPRPVSGARFTGASGQTNAHGAATLRLSTPGTASLVASKAGEIRSAADRITVTR